MQSPRFPGGATEVPLPAMRRQRLTDATECIARIEQIDDPTSPITQSLWDDVHELLRGLVDEAATSGSGKTRRAVGEAGWWEAAAAGLAEVATVWQNFDQEDVLVIANERWRGRDLVQMGVDGWREAARIAYQQGLRLNASGGFRLRRQWDESDDVSCDAVVAAVEAHWLPPLPEPALRDFTIARQLDALVRLPPMHMRGRPVERLVATVLPRHPDTKARLSVLREGRHGTLHGTYLPRDSSPCSIEDIPEVNADERPLRSRSPVTLIMEGLIAQFGARCQLCGGSRERLYVDHEHFTALTRGLVCHTCNIGRLTNCPHPDSDQCPVAAYLNNPPALHLNRRYPGGLPNKKRHRLEVLRSLLPHPELDHLSPLLSKDAEWKDVWPFPVDIITEH